MHALFERILADVKQVSEKGLSQYSSISLLTLPLPKFAH